RPYRTDEESKSAISRERSQKERPFLTVTATAQEPRDLSGLTPGVWTVHFQPRGGWQGARPLRRRAQERPLAPCEDWPRGVASPRRSEEHTSELQSRSDLVCRLLL